MGVRFLADFLFKSRTYSETKKLEDCNQLVIDGNNLLFALCSVSEGPFKGQYGGEYDAFQAKITTLFNGLQGRNIRSFIIFDGILRGESSGQSNRLAARKNGRQRDVERLLQGKRISRPIMPCLAKKVSSASQCRVNQNSSGCVLGDSIYLE